MQNQLPGSGIECGRHPDEHLINKGDLVVVTGANGFIGSRVVRHLLSMGFGNIRCLVRSESSIGRVRGLEEGVGVPLDYVCGNLLSRATCEAAASGAKVMYHLAVGADKTFPGCVMNTVVTTRNLLDAVIADGGLERFVNVSSLAIYSNDHLRRRAVLDE